MLMQGGGHLALFGMPPPRMNHFVPQPKSKLDPNDTKLHLHTCLFKAIWLGLVATRTDTNYLNILPEVPPPLHQPIQLQTSLGWDQLYQGCISAYWESMINMLHPQLAITGEQVMILIMKMIWIFILETWKLQTQHLHNNAAQLHIPNYQ